MKEQIFDILKEVLKTKEIKEQSSPENIENWDSLNHALIFDKIEKYFNIKIDLMEMLDAENVEDILNLLGNKTNNEN